MESVSDFMCVHVSARGKRQIRIDNMSVFMKIAGENI